MIYLKYFVLFEQFADNKFEDKTRFKIIVMHDIYITEDTFWAIFW
jgi:hypothetical protein